MRIVKVGENDPATDVADWVYYDQPENHIKLKDAAVSDYVRNGVLIGNTGNYYAIIKETGDAKDRDIYIYSQVSPSAKISIANVTVNSDHDKDNGHDGYYDVQKITMSANETYKVIPIRVTAQDGTCLLYTS